MAQSRQPNRLTRNLTVGFLVLVVCYALAGFLLLPWWLERILPEQLNERMGWQAEVGGISVNPFMLSLEAVGVSARDSDDDKVVGFDRLALDFNFFQLVRGIIGFEAIELQDPFFRLDLLDDYSVNFARDWQNNNPDPEPTGNDQASTDSTPTRFYFQQITIDGGELLFRDFSQPQPAEFQITPLDVSLSDLATWPRDERDSSYKLQAALGDETIAWEGQLSIAPLYSSGSLSISGVGFETLKHFLAPYLPYDLRGGQVSLRSEYEFQAGEFLLLTTRNGHLSLDDLVVAIDADSDEARLTSGTIDVNKIEFDLGAREASVGQVTLDALEVAVAREESGQIDWLGPLESAEGGQASSGAESPPFRWSVDGITLAKGRVQWQDRQLDTPAELILEQLSLTTGPLTHRLEEPLKYRAQATLASGGQLTLDGQLTPQPFTLEAAISGSEVTLAAFEPYLQEGANLAIAGGVLGVDGNLDLDGQQEPLTGTFSGTAEIAGLVLRLPDEKDRLVAWQSLRLAPIEYNVNPARLEIGTVTLTQPEVNVVRGANDVHNLARVARPDGGGQPKNASGTASGDGAQDPGFIFRIGQLMLENGSIGYTDRTLSPAFTTSFDELTGSIIGLSNIAPQQGKVDIRGRVGKVATMDFSGTLGTLGTDDVSDLELNMKGVSLPALAPYFGRYIGYGVDSGKLDLDLKYEIAGTRVNANNLVVLDRLELGQPVASDDAVDAPVALGLALLRDQDGVIEVDLPINGDLSDPDFAVGRVVMRAFVNLLVSAATSPFNMLGSIAEMAGFSGDELGQVGFLPGSAQLAEGEAGKLAALADGLLERPNLLLNVRGGVSTEADGLALLREELTAGGKQALSDEDWQVAREAYLAGERTLPPEALNNLASARGLAVKKVLQDTHEVPEDQLFMLDPSRDAKVDERGAVTVQFTLDVR